MELQQHKCELYIKKNNNYNFIQVIKSCINIVCPLETNVVLENYRFLSQKQRYSSKYMLKFSLETFIYPKFVLYN